MQSITPDMYNKENALSEPVSRKNVEPASEKPLVSVEEGKLQPFANERKTRTKQGQSRVHAWEWWITGLESYSHWQL